MRRLMSLTRSTCLSAGRIEEALSWGLAEPEPAIDEALETVLETVRHEEPHPRDYPRLTADISWFTQNLLDGRAAGLPTGERRS